MLRIKKETIKDGKKIYQTKIYNYNEDSIKLSNINHILNNEDLKYKAYKSLTASCK